MMKRNILLLSALLLAMGVWADKTMLSSVSNGLSTVNDGGATITIEESKTAYTQTSTGTWQTAWVGWELTTGTDLSSYKGLVVTLTTSSDIPSDIVITDNSTVYGNNNVYNKSFDGARTIYVDFSKVTNVTLSGMKYIAISNMLANNGDTKNIKIKEAYLVSQDATSVPEQYGDIQDIDIGEATVTYSADKNLTYTQAATGEFQSAYVGWKFDAGTYLDDHKRVVIKVADGNYFPKNIVLTTDKSLFGDYAYAVPFKDNTAIFNLKTHTDAITYSDVTTIGIGQMLYGETDEGTLTITESYFDEVDAIESRTLPKGKNIGVVCLPYNAEAYGADVYSLVGVDSKEKPKDLYVKKVETLEAGKPYIFYTDSRFVDFYRTDDSQTATTTAQTVNGLHGVLNETTVNTDGAYVVSGGRFKKANNVSLKANRAYLVLTETPEMGGNSSGAKLSVFGDETTNIGAIAVDNVDGEIYYDLSGRRTTTPKKGVYIHNGKKVIFK